MPRAVAQADLWVLTLGRAKLHQQPAYLHQRPCRSALRGHIDQMQQKIRQVFVPPVKAPYQVLSIALPVNLIHSEVARFPAARIGSAKTLRLQRPAGAERCSWRWCRWPSRHTIILMDNQFFMSLAKVVHAHDLALKQLPRRSIE